MSLLIQNSIAEASKVIGKTWPLYTFVASNPLSGYENASFKDAVALAQKRFHANAFPAAKLYRQALNNGSIDETLLLGILKENDLPESAELYLKLLESQEFSEVVNRDHNLDRIMAKWISAFMDEGLAEWEMPYKSEGFYSAWRFLVIYDSEVGSTTLKEIPKSSIEALQQLLARYDESDYTEIFTHHLSALPGWTGYINHRTQSNSDWQKEYPIDLTDYLAVRLWTAKKLHKSLSAAPEDETVNAIIPRLQHIWLQAWEKSWQNELLSTLHTTSSEQNDQKNNTVPDAQMVFCIDTRSELIRRHVESKGNYETFGYAGFFGIVMDYQSLNDSIVRKSCPPIVASRFVVSEVAQNNKNERFVKHQRKIDATNFVEYFLKRMKNMLPSAFGYVEGSGFYYALSLIARTILPGAMYRRNQKFATAMESTCQPDITTLDGSSEVANEVSVQERAGIVKSAFDLMGWKEFAPLILFVGHGSHSANNPFASSLDCGACAASPGRHNARMLAKLANLVEVRDYLAKNHDIIIPKDTFFIGAEHNTTTDNIIIFDSEAPDSHVNRIKVLSENLAKAQQTATENRLGSNGNSVIKSQVKANNWGETRPEWGLAKNAGFIVGPRHLTKNTNLDSRCFLHSYNWETDPQGTALEGIMQGPMVVTQWINSHYYFSTIDNNVYGGGTKITHNVTGKFGVVQGNGGDLKMGLPLQSLYGSDHEMHHQPLRLSVVIQAPIQRVSTILENNEHLKSLLDNEWIYLMIIDPKQQNNIFTYCKDLQWEVPKNEPSQHQNNVVQHDSVSTY